MRLDQTLGQSRHVASRSRRTAALAGFFDLSHVFDGLRPVMAVAREEPDARAIPAHHHRRGAEASHS